MKKGDGLQKSLKPNNKIIEGVSWIKDKKSVRHNLDWYRNKSFETQINLFGNFLEVTMLSANQIPDDEIKIM